MPEATQVNPRKKYNWAIEIDGFEAALAQRFTPPTVEAAVSTHGEAGQGPQRKTAGKKMVGEATLENLIPADKTDTTLWNWLTQDVIGKPPSEYQKDITIVHYDEDGEAVLERRTMKDAWVSKVEEEQLDKASDADNMIEKVTLQCHDYVREE